MPLTRLKYLSIAIAFRKYRTINVKFAFSQCLLKKLCLQNRLDGCLKTLRILSFYILGPLYVFQHTENKQYHITKNTGTPIFYLKRIRIYCRHDFLVSMFYVAF